MVFRLRSKQSSPPLADRPDIPPQGEAGPAKPRTTFGAVEMWGRDFVSGWVVPGRADFHIEIVFEDGEIAPHALFAKCRVAGAPDDVETLGFVCTLDRLLRDGERLIVRMNGGEELEGSPLVYRPAREDDSDADVPVRVHLEKPEGGLYRALARFAGWASLQADINDLSFRVDGIEQEVRFNIRPDVIQHLGSPHCLGWEFTCDVATGKARGFVSLQILLNNRAIFERRIDVHLVPNNALVLFMHIPKTAGMSVIAAIENQNKIDGCWLYGSLRSSIDDQMSRISPEAFADLDIVGGHFTHGLHRKIARRCLYITILREPASYLKSYFLYRKYVQRWPPVQRLDIFDALDARVDHLLDNGMTRFFAPMPPPRPVEAADLTRAKETMERDFAFVGLSERMAETVSRISALLRAPLEVCRENRTPHSAEADAIDLVELAERAEPYLRYDRELYARAQSLFW